MTKLTPYLRTDDTLTVCGSCGSDQLYARVTGWYPANVPADDLGNPDCAPEFDWDFEATITEWRCLACDADNIEPIDRAKFVAVDDDAIAVQPRAGDVCRIRDEEELWIPYGGVGNLEETGRFRFARYPGIDRVEFFDVERVCEVVIPIEEVPAREAWARLCKRFPDHEMGTFSLRVFVFRAHDDDCMTFVWDAYGVPIFCCLSPSTAAARGDVESHIPTDREVVWCVGREALEPHIESGALVGVTFGDVS